MGYTQYGPFTNGSAPGISAAFLNALETYLLTVNSAAIDSHLTTDTNGRLNLECINPAAVVTTAGTTSGSASLYMFMQSGFPKAFYLHFAGYRNSTGTEQTLALPTAMSYGVFISAGIPQIHIRASGANIASHCDIASGLPAGSGAGSSTTQSTFNAFSFGQLTASFDAVGLGTSQSATYTGGVFVIGI